MDIYNFINSKDIEKHCRNNQYEFSPLERAFLIWQSRKYTIQEKHSAYMELIEEFPEFFFYLREWDYKKISLQNFLMKYMRIENQLIDILMNNKSTGFLSAEETKIFHTFDKMKIEVPLPFKDNDLLVEKYNYYAVPFEYKIEEFEFSDTGMGLCSWIYPFEEEIYVSNYLNLEYAPKFHQVKYEPNDEDVPF